MHQVPPEHIPLPISRKITFDVAFIQTNEHETEQRVLEDGKTALTKDHASDMSDEVQRVTKEVNQLLIRLDDIKNHEQLLNSVNEQTTTQLLTMCLLTTAFILLIAFLQMEGVVTAIRKRRR